VFSLGGEEAIATIGEERSAATLISLGNDSTEQTLPVGDDGKAVFTVKSNGVQVTSALMQRVGFTLSRSDQQTVDNQPVVQDVRIAQHSRSNAGHQNEGDTGLADKELYGWFTEAALKGLLCFVCFRILIKPAAIINALPSQVVQSGTSSQNNQPITAP
jgi:hypothetical protein